MCSRRLCRRQVFANPAYLAFIEALDMTDGIYLKVRGLLELPRHLRKHFPLDHSESVTFQPPAAGAPSPKNWREQAPKTVWARLAVPKERVWEDAHAAACGLRRAEDLGFGSPADSAKVRKGARAKGSIPRSKTDLERHGAPRRIRSDVLPAAADSAQGRPSPGCLARVVRRARSEEWIS